MLKYKLIFFLAAWKRPEITEICFMGLRRLKQKFGVPAFAVISEASMIPLCKKYGVEWCMTENDYLGRKKNFGLTELIKKKWDYLIELGSDDLFKNEFMELYQWNSHVLGLRDFIMMNSEDGECRRLSDRNAAFGLGRAISRQAVEAFISPDGNVRLWSDKATHGMDNNSTFALAKKGFLERRVSSGEPLAIDVKSEVNLWPFKRDGIEYDYAKAISGLSHDEVCALKSLHVTV